MSFQWIIDNAVDVTIDKSGLNAQTVSRDSVVRTVSRGTKPWKFSITPSPGLRWFDAGVRSNIAVCEDYGISIPEDSLGFSSTGHNWLFAWQGTGNSTGMTASYVKGQSEFTLSGGGSLSNYAFKAGDIIQIGTHVYGIAEDVPVSQIAHPILVNRPIIEETGTSAITVGSLCRWTLQCIKFPSYKITPLGFIEWSGTFDFIEVI